MPGEQVGSAFATIGLDASALNSGLNAAKVSFSSAVGSMQANLTKGSWNKVGGTIGNDLVSGITAPLGSLSGAAASVVTAIGPAGIVAAGAVAGAAVIGSAASQAAMEWEAGMSRISKTTGIEKGSEAFTTLSSDLQDLYATMPTTVSEIQGVATAAGSLGIASDSIAGFTEVALQMGSAFEIPAEQAANAVGKIKSQLKSYSDEVKTAGGAVDDAKFAQHFGSAVDYAGNALNASESEVLDFSTRTAGAFSNLGGNMYELAGWGGELASVFSSSELAAGSFNAALNQLMGTTKGSENARAKAGELLGVTPEEFQELMTNDPTDTLLDIGKAMEGLSDTEKFQAAGILGGGYGDDFFQKMVGKTDEWRGKIDEVVAAGQKGESIGDSFAAGAANGKAAFQMLGNAANAILQDIGGKDGVGGINSIIAPVVAGLAVGLNKIRTIGENLWGPFTTAISPATTAVSLLAEGIGSLAGMSLDVLVAGSEAINTAFEVGSAFVEAFGEEVTKVITESSTFKTVAGYVESVGDAFSSLYDSASEVFDKIVSGLSEAIPTAVSGAATAVGTLLDKAGLGGITDAASSVGSFLGDVYDNAAEKLGWGVEKGTEEGMEAGSEAAKETIASTTEAAVSEGFKNASPAIKSALSAGYSDLEALSIINNSGVNIKADEVLSSTSMGLPGLDQYTARTWLEYHGSRSDTQMGFFDSSGALVSDVYDAYVQSERDAAYEGFIKGIQPGILDANRYFEAHSGELKDVVSSAWSDGAISGTEKTNLEALKSNLEALKLQYPVEFEASGLQDTLDDAQTLLDGNPLEIEVNAKTDDLYSQVWDAVMGGNTDWSALGVSDPSRYLTAAKKSLQSDISSYAEAGLAVPMKDAEGNVTEIGERLLALQSAFHENYASLDATNRTSSALLDQAISKGGEYWDVLYAHMGLLSDDIQTSASTLETKSTAGATSLFNSANYVSTKLDSAGNEIAVIGSSVKSGGVAGGAAVASGGQTAASYLISGASQAADKLRYSTTANGGILDAGNVFGLKSSTKSGTGVSGSSNFSPLAEVAASGAASGVSSALSGWGGTPKGWTGAMEDAKTSTTSATKSTDSLCSSVSGLASDASSAAASVSSLSTSLSNSYSSQFQPLAGTIQSVATSAYDTSEALSYTAESMDGWCEAASDFAYWQETTKGLFQESYIGPTSSYPGNSGSSGSSGSSGGGYTNKVGTTFGSKAVADANPYFQLPAIFRARGGLIDKGPELAIVGEAGAEMILPPSLTKAVLNMTGNGGGGQIIINSPITIPAGMDASEFEAILARRNAELEKRISTASRGL